MDQNCEEIDVYLVGQDNIGKRLDVFIAELYADASRSYLQKLIKEGLVLVNELTKKPSYKLEEEDKVEVTIPQAETLEVIAQDLELDIVYEDNDLLVVNKKQGMVVHPAPGNPDGTLVNAIMYHCKDKLSSINGVIRPGIVHRIDKNTSGLLVIAKNNASHQCLADQFKIHSITREYEMVCIGGVDWEEMTVDKNIGRNPKDRLKMAVLNNSGRSAVTHFKVLEHLSGYTYMKANLETGRTHQIRVHSNYLRHPILGDDLYGYQIKKFSNLKGQTLHARKLGFIHPSSGKYIEFTSDLPDYFKHILDEIRR